MMKTKPEAQATNPLYGKFDTGNQIMWRGYQRLSAATLGHRIALEAGSKIALATEKKWVQGRPRPLDLGVSEAECR